MEIKCRDEIIQSVEKMTTLANYAIAHLESLNRNLPHDLSIHEKREYSNKLYDELELFDRFKQNTMILLNEAVALPPIEIPATIQRKATEPAKKEKAIQYDNDFAYTTIEKIVLCGREYHVRNWANALITIVEMLVKEQNIEPELLVGNKNLKGKKRNYFSMNPNTLKRAYPVSNGCYLELNFSARDIYKISHLLVEEFGYLKSDFEILFRKKHSDSVIAENDATVIGKEPFNAETFDDPIKMLKEIEKQM